MNLAQVLEIIDNTTQTTAMSKAEALDFLEHLEAELRARMEVLSEGLKVEEVWHA